jgi:hypothetical protein
VKCIVTKISAAGMECRPIKEGGDGGAERERRGDVDRGAVDSGSTDASVERRETSQESALAREREEREKENTLDSGLMLMPIDTNTPSSTSEEVAYSKYTEVVPTTSAPLAARSMARTSGCTPNV